MTPNEKQTLAFVINELKPVQKINSLEFDLDERAGGYLVAHCQMEFDTGDPVYAVFTLGRFSNHIFLTITNGDPVRLANVLAGVERYDSSNKQLGFGHTMRMENKYLDENNKSALLFLRPRLLPFLDNFQDCSDVGGRHLEFFLVVFLNEDEYTHKLSNGLDALYDKFQAEKKNLFAIG
ncbi:MULTISPECIES: suppressor of fused domain protein [unclassified Duganella]|uniref:suppressor of fused domain protein n=1 Tax=unclassified Duganella TaxID=2636909 RepID=UPI0007003254|nr:MULTISPECIES: suppressor of fused domain protein [unclassified Duganella]KQV50187.1 hypothetical protein ASD07_29625 [Duganella sp. Root336D2]KRB85161.1 hypothetical protein ASE26_29555 [Duganella sp. Root198D2]